MLRWASNIDRSGLYRYLLRGKYQIGRLTAIDKRVSRIFPCILQQYSHLALSDLNDNMFWYRLKWEFQTQTYNGFSAATCL